MLGQGHFIKHIIIIIKKVQTTCSSCTAQKLFLLPLRVNVLRDGRRTPPIECLCHHSRDVRVTQGWESQRGKKTRRWGRSTVLGRRREERLCCAREFTKRAQADRRLTVERALKVDKLIHAHIHTHIHFPHPHTSRASLLAGQPPAITVIPPRPTTTTYQKPPPSRHSIPFDPVRPCSTHV